MASKLKTIGAVMFVHNGNKFDYCYRETITCMKAFADKVVVLDAGSDDGTAEECLKFKDDKTTVVTLSKQDWDSQSGKEKLAYFQNEAKRHLSTDYCFVLQADEILHESSFVPLRQAVNEGHEGVFVCRINLWFTPWLALNVAQNRKPCSTAIVRLSKTKYDSFGDGESVCVPSASPKWLNHIRIYHMGFVRDPKKMKAKVIHIQEQVFGVGHDSRVDHSDVFEPDRFFDRKDVSPITEKLPKFIQQWALERYPEGR